MKNNIKFLALALVVNGIGVLAMQGICRLIVAIA